MHLIHKQGSHCPLLKLGHCAGASRKGSARIGIEKQSGKKQSEEKQSQEKQSEKKQNTTVGRTFAIMTMGVI